MNNSEHKTSSIWFYLKLCFLLILFSGYARRYVFCLMTYPQLILTIPGNTLIHYSDVIIGAMASLIISVSIVYSTVCPGADQRKHKAPLTLSQWQFSDNPVAIQCAWSLDPSVQWNATWERIVGSQWSSSGLPVVFQCVAIMQINTGLPLGHHWVLASASAVLVASQCTCGYSGLPVCSNYANGSSSGLPLGDNISQCGSSAVCPVVSQCTESVWLRDH